jgi:hypothetical protein
MKSEYVMGGDFSTYGTDKKYVPSFSRETWRKGATWEICVSTGE